MRLTAVLLALAIGHAYVTTGLDLLEKADFVEKGDLLFVGVLRFESIKPDSAPNETYKKAVESLDLSQSYLSQFGIHPGYVRNSAFDLRMGV